MAPPLEGEEDAVLLSRRDAAEKVDHLEAGAERLLAELRQLRAGQQAGDRYGELAAEMLRHPLVVAGQDLHRDAVAFEALQDGGDSRLRGVEKGRKAGKDQLPLVLD